MEQIIITFEGGMVQIFIQEAPEIELFSNPIVEVTEANIMKTTDEDYKPLLGKYRLTTFVSNEPVKTYIGVKL